MKFKKMGLLTDPGAGRGKLTQVLVCHHSKLCALSYIGGVIWFTLLARDAFNAGTYFSENALLPGLVKEEFDESAIAKTYLSEINDEADRYPDAVPYPWLIAKLKQLNLDTYTHNFTLHYPLGPGRKFTGKNVYGILRAPRGASTEALVLTVPYRPPNSIHPTTAPSLALALSLAKFFRKQKYWAKDIIFLVTEHEQLGVQAWLEAYHGVSCGRDGVLDAGSLSGRGGSIQAAINLEIHSDQVASIDVKIEGLNGQLPNLDLVNLVHRMCLKEGIRHTFKDRDDPRDSETYEGWMHAFHTLMLMVFTQASGVPNGNHGLFHRVVERVFRSLNNLLERFHQSFFFYLLPATDRYISIGMYMPPLGMIGGGLLIKAFVLWLKMQEDKESSPYSEKSRRDGGEVEEKRENGDSDKEAKIAEDKEENKEKGNNDEELRDEECSKLPNPASFKEQGVQSIRNGLAWACAVFLSAHVIGLALLSSTKGITVIGYEYLGLPTEFSLFIGFVIASLLLIVLFPVVCSSASEKPSPCKSQSNGTEWAPFLNIAALLELATVLLAISMHNFSLGLVYAVVFTPSALWIAPTKSRFGIEAVTIEGFAPKVKSKTSPAGFYQLGKLRKGIQRILWLPLQPIILLVIVSLIYTAVMFPEEFAHFDQSFLTRAFSAASNALTFSVVDSYAYGSWFKAVSQSRAKPGALGGKETTSFQPHIAFLSG
ncbi:hypothetical protein J437_LFUL001098 [Ladona fulva]|uniref:Glycosylphosphatidylinositol anchor attachment 1 protein n=1 Tax=Ladona fulva TaxID=123851 RepID=A0A8K0JXA2_LADFU|nr:hypothetical protein J437_LFUL001098 [Ladona fulva]